MRLLVCGGRNYADWDFLHTFLDRLEVLGGIRCGNAVYGPVHVLINGGAKGADTLAVRWAEERGIKVETYTAQWSKYGDRAGPIRNIEMIRDGKPSMVVCFPGGNGTAHMKEIAMRANVFVLDADKEGI